MNNRDPKLRKKILDLFNKARTKESMENVKKGYIDKLISGTRKSAIFDSVVSELDENDKAFLNDIRNKNQKPVNQVTTVNELDYYKGSSFITIHQDVEIVDKFVVARLKVDDNYNVIYDSPANKGAYEYSGPITKEGDHIYINFTEQTKKIEKFNIFFKEPFYKNNNYVIHACSTFLSTEKFNINHVMAPMILIKGLDLNLGTGIFDKKNIESTFCNKPSEHSEKYSESIFRFFKEEAGYPIIIKPYALFKTDSTAHENSFFIGFYYMYWYSSTNPNSIAVDLLEVYQEGLVLKAKFTQIGEHKIFNYSGVFRVISNRNNIYITFTEKETNEEINLTLMISPDLRNINTTVLLTGALLSATIKDNALKTIAKGVILEKLNCEPKEKPTASNRYIRKTDLKRDKENIFNLLEQMKGGNGYIIAADPY